jgi:hypothetical protein
MSTLEDFDREFNLRITSINITSILMGIKMRMASPTGGFTAKQRGQIGLNLAEFLLTCEVMQRECDRSAIVPHFDYMYGNCFRINAYRPNESSSRGNADIGYFRQKERGFIYGLKLVVFTGVPDAPSLTSMLQLDETYGLVVSIENQTALPLTATLLKVQPGTCAHIALRKQVYLNIPAPYSDCESSESYAGLFRGEFDRLKLTYQRDTCIEA